MRGAEAMAMVAVVVVLGAMVAQVEGATCTKDMLKGCNKTVEQIFTVDMFEGMFNHRNDRVAHAQSFWTYDSFIAAAKLYEKEGFGTIGGDVMQKRELAAFFAHVAHETSCKPLQISISVLLLLTSIFLLLFLPSAGAVHRRK
jgi:hypothetical protein